ncbi:MULTISPECIES: Uma2 family endonuclease [unclassified Nodularia (in: cyanobacteria)]|uniref:Uma2 family endonuclease n=1 Tax=unclassified Nodularia (in: cyanobacteria) TaxID=2656917 RepID=UPI0018810D8A|nr:MULTISPECIES: Uma2 family endonuclease [unclassified Nodularia (in: cyanobacteria)]MBE9200500.1 Uma2 family endonuclease [Nodularia sp. LEGE 06071]MCC2691208.1 Uma2 family endonuclease [Nodularia sp. LEGE 04288]
MVQTPTKSLTLEEFLQQPETKPASEFIDGQIIQKPMPQGKHSTLQVDLGADINLTLKPQHIARAYSELRCTFGGRSIVPDIAVFRWERIPRDDNGKVSNTFAIAPDWTIEILSPDQSQTKVVRNILHCLNHGTQMGWLIDPEEEVVFAYFANRTLAVFELASDRLPVPPFAESFNLTVGKLFSWLTE